MIQEISVQCITCARVLVVLAFHPENIDMNGIVEAKKMVVLLAGVERGCTLSG